MRKSLLWAGVIPGLALLIAGCGGSGTSTATTPSPNPGQQLHYSEFYGPFVGTLTDSGGSVGAVSIYATFSGTVTGRLIFPNYVGDGYVQGTIEGGVTQISITIRNLANSPAPSTKNYSGTLAVNSTGGLTGTLVDTSNSSHTITISTPSIATASKFAGTYDEDLQILNSPPATPTNQVECAIVDSTGKLNLYVETAVIGPVSTTDASNTYTGTINANGLVSVTPDTGGTPLTGTLTYTTTNNVGVLAGTLSNSTTSLPLNMAADKLP